MLRIAPIVSLPEAEWSDEDDNVEKYIVKPQVDTFGDEESLDSFQINDVPDKLDSSVIGPDRLVDHKRSRYSGYVAVNKLNRAQVNTVSQKVSCVTWYPPVPTDVEQSLGPDLLCRVWNEFIRLGADDAEMIPVKEARRLAHCDGLQDLPILEIAMLRKMEANDYVEFTTLMKMVAELYRPHEKLCSSQPTGDICRVCCTMKACQHSLPQGPRALTRHSTPSNEHKDGSRPGTAGSENNVDLPQFHFVGSEEHRLNVIYSEVKHLLNGKVRVNHVAQIMDRMAIPFEKSRLPRSFWVNRGELFIGSMSELADLISQLRTDLEQKVDPLAAMFKYELPQWLREEFKASEIMLYEHHFALIDKDGGGSIDVDELQALVTAFGSSISREDAQNMLDEYDMDGGGTIDFVEFMVLIYKIQRGTIDLSSSDLAQALVEAKAQLKIFEEIEEVSRDPPACCAVAHFGGSPVECAFHIEGPPGSPYEGLRIVLRMTFHDGYPFRQPDIVLRGRVMGLHVLPALGGDSHLMHIKQLWSAEWSMHRLLAHVADILGRPDPQLLPDHLYDIYASWETRLQSVRPDLRKAAAQQLREERRADAKEAVAESSGAQQQSAKAEGGGRSSKLPTPALSARADAKPDSGRQVSSRPVSGAQSGGDAESDKNGSGLGDKKGGTAEEPLLANDEQEAVAVAERALRLERALSMDALSDDATRRRVLALSRIERMHLATMLVHLLDPAQYHAAVAGFMRLNYKAGED
jgi:ubiquitin-protein ligase